MTPDELARTIVGYADDKKAQEILELDLRGVVGYTDFFVICSGTTERQTKAIHDGVYAGLKKEHGVLPRRVEGLPQARWILMDYLDVVVHVFTPETREYYRLEQLWGEVPTRALGAGAASTTATGRARFASNPLDVLAVPTGHLLLQTVRSHDQFNTTIYGLDDRYRGIKSGRRVVFVNPDDLAALGFSDGDHVDLVGVWSDGERRAEDFRVVSYATARGCAAAYFPETNVLVPLDSVAKVSNTPVSKSVLIRLEPRG